MCGSHAGGEYHTTCKIVKSPCCTPDANVTLCVRCTQIFEKEFVSNVCVQWMKVQEEAKETGGWCLLSRWYDVIRRWVYLTSQKPGANVHEDLHCIQTNQNVYSKPFMFTTLRDPLFHAATFWKFRRLILVPVHGGKYINTAVCLKIMETSNYSPLHS